MFFAGVGLRHAQQLHGLFHCKLESTLNLHSNSGIWLPIPAIYGHWWWLTRVQESGPALEFRWGASPNLAGGVRERSTYEVLISNSQTKVNLCVTILSLPYVWLPGHHIMTWFRFRTLASQPPRWTHNLWSYLASHISYIRMSLCPRHIYHSINDETQAIWSGSRPLLRWPC
jgi:hypothetical protein